MKPKAYVGITGPATKKEIKAVAKEFNKNGYTMDSLHIPMIGYLVSYKTLNEKTTNDKRYPKFSELEDLLKITDNKVLTMIHYNSKETDTLASQVSRIFDGIYQKKLCRAVQFNIAWPNPHQVELVKKEFPEMQILFQISHKIIVSKTQKEIIEGMKEYNGNLSYVLIDPSGGKGLEFDIKESLQMYQELKIAFPSLTIGFAGGFSGKNVSERVKKIINETGDKDFCIDAEGRLRDKLSEDHGDSLLNMEKVKAYLKGASSILE